MNLEEVESDGRSLVQLDAGSANFNTTLNLTGPIILGMTIASASLLYAYYKAYPRPKNAGSYGYGYNRSRNENEIFGNTTLWV